MGETDHTSVKVQAPPGGKSKIQLSGGKPTESYKQKLARERRELLHR